MLANYKMSIRDVIVTPTRQGQRRRTGFKTQDSRFTEQNSITLGRTSCLFLLVCVEHIKYKIKLHRHSTLPKHDRETQPIGLELDSKVKRAPLCSPTFVLLYALT